MTETLLVSIVSGGINIAILAFVVSNTLRIGNLQGSMKNGDFVRCPFFKKRVNNAVNCNDGKATKDGRKALSS